MSEWTKKNSNNQLQLVFRKIKTIEQRKSKIEWQKSAYAQTGQTTKQFLTDWTFVAIELLTVPFVFKAQNFALSEIVELKVLTEYNERIVLGPCEQMKIHDRMGHKARQKDTNVDKSWRTNFADNLHFRFSFGIPFCTNQFNCISKQWNLTFQIARKAFGKFISNSVQICFRSLASTTPIEKWHFSALANNERAEQI